MSNQETNQTIQIKELEQKIRLLEIAKNPLVEGEINVNDTPSSLIDTLNSIGSILTTLRCYEDKQLDNLNGEALEHQSTKCYMIYSAISAVTYCSEFINMCDSRELGGQHYG